MNGCFKMVKSDYKQTRLQFIDAEKHSSDLNVACGQANIYSDIMSLLKTHQWQKRAIADKCSYKTFNCEIKIYQISNVSKSFSKGEFCWRQTFTPAVSDKKTVTRLDDQL